MIEQEPEPLPESVQFDGRNGAQIVDWARRTSEHYERPDRISASGLSDSTHDNDRFTLNVNGKEMTPAKGDTITFSDRQREFQHLAGPENPWPRDHPHTPAENRVLYQLTARSGELPEGVIPPVRGVATAADKARHPSQYSTTGQPGVRHPVQPVREPYTARQPQFGEHRVTDITNRVGRNK